MATVAAPSPMTTPPQTNPRPSRAPLAASRKFAFIGIAVLALLLLAEGATRIFQRVGQATTGATNPYIDFVNPVPLFERRTLDGKEWYVRTPYQTFVPRDTRFSAVKAPGTLRVFLLGSSAAAGWPHHEEHNGFTIAALLAQKLRKLYPERTIEVLNVAGPTYGSHRVRFVFDEVINLEPDLILLYNGNNEFVETFVFEPHVLPDPFGRSAFLRALDDAVRRLGSQPLKPAVDIRNYSEADTVSNRISLLFGQGSKYRRDPRQFQQLLDRHRFNLESMVREAKRRGVPLFLMNVPVNLKDWIPNVSVHSPDLPAEKLALWQERFRAGLLALEAGDYTVAADAFAASVAADDEYAEGHFNLGTALLKLGRAAEAKARFIKALERDAYPFRELPAFDRQLREIARVEGVPVVDSVGILEARAGDGILGLDMLIDYVHLTGSSQEAIAQGVLQEMDRQKLLAGPRAVELDAVIMAVPKVFDDMATDRGLVSLYRQLLLMRQYDKIDVVHERLMTYLRTTQALEPGRAEWARQYLQITEYIHSALVPYRKLLRAEKLGIVASEYSEQEARTIFDNYVQMVKNVEGANMDRDDFRSAVPQFAFPAASTD